MELKEWADKLRVSPGFEEKGAEILALLDNYEDAEETIQAVETALVFQGVKVESDIVATLEQVMARYAFVVDTFTEREEFDLGDDDYMVKMLGVLTEGDRALSFKWKVMGILRETGAIAAGKCEMSDDVLLSILKMMMP